MGKLRNFWSAYAKASADSLSIDSLQFDVSSIFRLAEPAVALAKAGGGTGI